MATTASTTPFVAPSQVSFPPCDLASPAAYPMEWTLADLQERLDGIPLERIHLYPWPGLATEKDVLDVLARTGWLCELVDGILVEKPMGFYCSCS